MGSTPTLDTSGRKELLVFEIICGHGVAWLTRLPVTEETGGSNPPARAKKQNRPCGGFCFCFEGFEPEGWVGGDTWCPLREGKQRAKRALETVGF